jgi:hypothetical protein
MRGEDGKFISQPDSLDPKPVCIKLPTDVREWIKCKGTEFHRELVLKAWEAEMNSSPKIASLRIKKAPLQHFQNAQQTQAQTQDQIITLSSIACPKCTCDKFKVFLTTRKYEVQPQPQLQCTFCNHVFSP